MSEREAPEAPHAVAESQWSGCKSRVREDRELTHGSGGNCEAETALVPALFLYDDTDVLAGTGGQELEEAGKRIGVLGAGSRDARADLRRRIRLVARNPRWRRRPAPGHDRVSGV